MEALPTKQPGVLDYVKNAVDSQRAHIDRDPFPHLVVNDVLPQDIYDELERNFPSAEYIADGEEITNNRTYLRTSDRILADEQLSPLWRDFVETNTSHSTFETAVSLWQADIERLHPGLEENFGKPLAEFESARRSGQGDSPINRRADAMIDCQFGMNSPVESLSASRGPHVDRGAKLFSALLYLRDAEDTSTGGEYELFKLKGGPFPERKMKKIPFRYLESVKRYPYRANSIVMWMNTPEAIHAVTPRTVTPLPRRYIAISGESFGGARPSGFFSHFPQWDSLLGRLRAEIGLS